jgi:hypothetical protein
MSSYRIKRRLLCIAGLGAFAWACGSDPSSDTAQAAMSCYPGYPGCDDGPPDGVSFLDVDVVSVPIDNDSSADLVARPAASDGRRTIHYRHGGSETLLFGSGYPIYAAGVKVGSGTVVCSGIAATAADLTDTSLRCRASSGGAWSANVDLGARAWLEELAVDTSDADKAVIAYKIYETSPMDVSPAGFEQDVTCLRRTWQGGVWSEPTECAPEIVIGSPCDDNNPCTINDRWVSEGICQGDYIVIDGCGEPGECDYDVSQCPPVPPAGTPCDDGFPNTINDRIRSDGHCVGDPL